MRLVSESHGFLSEQGGFLSKREGFWSEDGRSVSERPGLLSGALDAMSGERRPSSKGQGSVSGSEGT